MGKKKINSPRRKLLPVLKGSNPQQLGHHDGMAVWLAVHFVRLYHPQQLFRALYLKISKIEKTLVLIILVLVFKHKIKIKKYMFV